MTNATLDHRIAIERRSQPETGREHNDADKSKSFAHGHRMSQRPWDLCIGRVWRPDAAQKGD
jgi:hypothetical protein